MGKPAEVLMRDVKAYRVLKPFGHWEFGDVIVGSTATMLQGLRTGAVERAPERDYEVTYELASDAEQKQGTFVKNLKARQKAKTADGEKAPTQRITGRGKMQEIMEPDDGSPSV